MLSRQRRISINISSSISIGGTYATLVYTRINGHASVTHPKQTPLFEWCVNKCGSKKKTPKKNMFKRD